MKQKIYLFILLLMLFVPKVYAFSYDFGIDVVNISSNDNSLQEIRVSLKDIQGSDFGIASCTLNITFNGDVKLNSDVRSLGSWTLTKGKFYLLDTSRGVHNKDDLFIVPVKVNGKGSVNIIDIECFDDKTSMKLNNKTINLEYVKNNSNIGNTTNTTNNNNSSVDGTTNKDVAKDSNCDLNNIVLSDGDIEFSSSVTEYYIVVENMDDLIITPELASDKAKFTISKGDGEVIIDVVAEDGSKKAYTIFIENSMKQGQDITDVNKNDDKNNYTYIFISIICLLVLINIVRIVINKRKKELE